jgi:hypothetical protein
MLIVFHGSLIPSDIRGFWLAPSMMLVVAHDSLYMTVG